MSRLALLLQMFVVFASVSAQQRESRDLVPFIKSYCLDCHGADKQEADRRFDLLPPGAPSAEDAESYQEILDQLNLGTMPPESASQPSVSERQRVVAVLTRFLNEAREAARRNPGKVILRRLNRVEYRNTIRDLFQLKMVDFDPTTTFPTDDPTDGFDNVGEGLVTSDFLLRNYLEAARKVADKAILPGPRPKMIHYTSGVERTPSQLSSGTADKQWRKEAGRMYIKFRQPLGIALLDKKRGVPASGEYAIRFSARAVRRKSRYKDEDLRYHSAEPMRLSISVDSRELGPTAHRIIGEYEIPDDRDIEIEHRVWLERGFTFHVHWANGPDGSFKRILRKVLPKYNKDALYPIRNPPEMYIGSGPELHVRTLEIEGPFYDSWPPPGFARFFPNPPDDPTPTYLDQSLLRLASAAFRRPVTPEELEPYLALSRSYLNKHRDFWAAAKYGVRAILTSPQFLYLAETSPSDPTKRNLSQHELATRLSYFLWSSMPDDQLRQAADDAALWTAGELRNQVQRMLDDPKSHALTENFTGQWLGLRRLGEMPPDPESNPTYYKDGLEEAMRQETQLFFGHLLAGNRSILEFIDSQYTYLNPALARHYGIDGVEGDSFRKVTLQPDDHRGGLLGHGSILTATSNGVETQPIVRGVWMLENLFGTPPNPPPPDVDPIEPDTRGVTTIRQLMEKHRNNPTCYQCHRKIDPIGLAMENYDYVGVWRERYTKQLPIDSSGKLPNGTTIHGVEGIKKHLLENPEQFTRCLTEKLMIYAIGRRLSFADRDDIQKIVNTMPQHHYGFRELIQQIVASEVFQIK